MQLAYPLVPRLIAQPCGTRCAAHIRFFNHSQRSCQPKEKQQDRLRGGMGWKQLRAKAIEPRRPDRQARMAFSAVGLGSEFSHLTPHTSLFQPYNTNSMARAHRSALIVVVLSAYAASHCATSHVRQPRSTQPTPTVTITMTAAPQTTPASRATHSIVNLSYSSFEVQCRALTAVYTHFSWCPPISRFHSDTGFLHCTRQRVDSVALSERQRLVVADDELQLLTDTGQLEVHESDELTLMPPPDSMESLVAPSAAVWCEWHVVYSSSYRVPVLLFQFTFSDGQPLDSEQVMQAIRMSGDGRSSSLVVDDAASSAEYPPVSCISHPALCRPFYCLHPCQTARVMSLLQTEPTAHPHVKCEESALDVLAWLSAVGPFVGLRLTFNDALQKAIAGR